MSDRFIVKRIYRMAQSPSERKPLVEYLQDVLQEAETTLTEGDYLTFANVLKEAHKKKDNPELPRTPYVYFPITGMSMVVSNCASNIKSAYISFNEVGANNLSAFHTSTIHIKGTIDISYKDDTLGGGAFDWYSSDNTETLYEYLTLMKVKTCEFNIMNVKRKDTFEEYMAEKKRNKSLIDFHEGLVRTAYHSIHSHFWNKISLNRANGTVY
jgi:hypothetical protein